MKLLTTTTMIKLFILLALSTQSLALTLTAENFRALLLQNHPQFQQLSLNEKNALLAKEVANPFAGYHFSSTLSYQNNDGTNNNTTDFTSYGITTSVSSKNSDGSTTSLGHILNKTESAYSNDITLSHSIPLIQNKGGINDTLAYDLAVIDEKITHINTMVSSEQFINTNLKKLITLAFLERKLAILSKKDALDKKQFELIKQKFTENIVDKTNVLLQQGVLKSNQINILNIEKQIHTTKEELQTLLNISFDEVSFDLENITGVLTQNSTPASLTILELKKDKLQRELNSLINQDEMDMSLTLNASINGDNTTFSDALGKFGTSFGASLGVSLPLESNVNESKIAIKHNQISANLAEQQSTTITLNNTRNTLLNTLQTTREIIALTKEQIALNTESYNEYQKMYDENNKELDFVLSAKNKLISAQLELLEQLKTYHTTLLDFKNANL